jgi:hypothetical protein
VLKNTYKCHGAFASFTQNSLSSVVRGKEGMTGELGKHVPKGKGLSTLPARSRVQKELTDYPAQ